MSLVCCSWIQFFCIIIMAIISFSLIFRNTQLKKKLKKKDNEIDNLRQSLGMMAEIPTCGGK